jgi:tetratricopeptide (TPR) repeat protein
VRSAVLLAALASAAPAGARAESAPAAAPPVAPATPPAMASPSPSTPAAAPADDPDLMAFAFSPARTAAQDGSVKLDWPGAGGSQLRISWDALETRNQEVENASMMAAAVMQAVSRFYETGGANPAAVREKLVAMAGAPLDEARASWLAAVEREGKRLFFVERALSTALREERPITGISADLVRRRMEAIRTGRAAAAVQERVEGYRSLALGLVAYVDGDTFEALDRLKRAARALPDVAVVHAFLGSLHYLFQQPDAATVAWKRALLLDPSNETVRSALREYGRPGR